MSSFLLVPGAGGAGWYWQRVADELSARGHRAVAIDLPAEDPNAGLPDYARVIVDAARTMPDSVLVGHSLGGFSIPIAAEELRPSRIVLVNAMIPVPGETAAEWGEHVGTSEARVAAAKTKGYSTDFDSDVYFFHDVPAETVAESAHYDREETERAFTDPCDFTSWAAPVTVLAGRDDRLIPFQLQEKIARERLQVDAVSVPGGHLALISQPTAVARAILNQSAT